MATAIQASTEVERVARSTNPDRRRELVAAAILLSPVLLLFAFTVVYPFFDTIRLSFFDIKGLAPPKFIGIGNYLKLFGDQVFRQSLVTTLFFSIGATTLCVSVGWVLAMLCAFVPKETTIFRTMIFAAFGVAETVVGVVWLDIYRPGPSGLLNSIMGIFGFSTTTSWLGDPNSAIWCLVAAAAWGAVGLPMMLCFASVQSISKTVLEAAYIDGANPLQVMWHIMMPLSMPGVRVSIFICLLGSLRTFDLIFVLTGGGPVRSTETVGYFVYKESMSLFKLGYGAAATIVLLAGVLIISVPAIIQRTAGAK
jgi:ABC-type sugar transport system permease subunit